MQYKLIIKYTDSLNDYNGLQDVIRVIGWCYQAKEGDEVLAELNGSKNMPEPNNDNFVGLDDVTLDMMVGWLEGLLDTEDLKLKLNNKL